MFSTKRGNSQLPFVPQVGILQKLGAPDQHLNDVPTHLLAPFPGNLLYVRESLREEVSVETGARVQNTINVSCDYRVGCEFLSLKVCRTFSKVDYTYFSV